MSEATVVERNEDMTPLGRLALIFQVDGDVIVAVRADPDAMFNTSVEFCQPGSGGGRSKHTLRALRELGEAMKRDNAESPIFPPKREPSLYRRQRSGDVEQEAEIDRLTADLAAAWAEVERLSQSENARQRLCGYFDFPIRSTTFDQIADRLIKIVERLKAQTPRPVFDRDGLARAIYTDDERRMGYQDTWEPRHRRDPCPAGRAEEVRPRSDSVISDLGRTGG